MPLSISSIVRDVCSQLMAVKYYSLSFYSIPILGNLDWAEKKNLINCGYKQLMTTICSESNNDCIMSSSNQSPIVRMPSECLLISRQMCRGDIPVCLFNKKITEMQNEKLVFLYFPLDSFATSLLLFSENSAHDTTYDTRIESTRFVFRDSPISLIQLLFLSRRKWKTTDRDRREQYATRFVHLRLERRW